MFTQPPLLLMMERLRLLMHQVTICPMSEADVDAVLDIECRSFPRPWSKQHFLDELKSSMAFPLVAFSGEGRVVGFICPMVVMDEGHILDVAVAPEARGQGIGKLLVERALHDCRDRGAAFVSLEVRISNRAAIELYRKLGFSETGLRRHYYENGEDALLMEYIYESEAPPHAV